MAANYSSDIQLLSGYPDNTDNCFGTSIMPIINTVVHNSNDHKTNSSLVCYCALKCLQQISTTILKFVNFFLKLSATLK